MFFRCPESGNVYYVKSRQDEKNHRVRAIRNSHPIKTGSTLFTRRSQKSRTFGIRSRYGIFGKRPEDCAGIDRKSKRKSLLTSKRKSTRVVRVSGRDSRHETSSSIRTAPYWYFCSGNA